jgi:hypothetical protein
LNAAQFVIKLRKARLEGAPPRKAVAALDGAGTQAMST